MSRRHLHAGFPSALSATAPGRDTARPDRRAARPRRGARPRAPPRPPPRAVRDRSIMPARSPARRSASCRVCSIIQPPPAPRSTCGIGLLVLVERMRQRHQDRRPADDGQFGDRRGAGAADHQMAGGDARRQVAEEGLRARPRRRMRRRPPRRASMSSGRHCWTTCRRRAQVVRQAARSPAARDRREAGALAAAEDQEVERLVLPARGIGRSRPPRAPPAAPDCRSRRHARAKRLGAADLGEAGGDRRHARRRESGWRGRARRSARG